MSSSATQHSILDAAEQLFGIQGFDGTSIRDITGAAGVNVASVHYHFGSKRDVLRAVLARVAGRINQRRIELLERVQNEGQPTPEAVIDAFVRADYETLFELQSRGSAVARFIGRIYSDRADWIQEMAMDQFGETGGLFRSALAAALPHVEEKELNWRIRTLVAVIVDAFSGYPDDGLTVRQSEQEIRRVVSFFGAGMRSPNPQPQTGEVTTRP